jgi:hypothetical protein
MGVGWEGVERSEISVKIFMKSLLTGLLIIFLVCKAASQHISKEELKPLNSIIGEWKVEADMRLSKNGPWEKSEARSVIKKAIGETIFEEDYAGTKQGRVLTMKSWLGNDNRTKLYQRIAVDSDHGVLIVYEGKLDNNMLTLQTSLNLNGVQLLLRVQYKIESTDSFTVENSRSTDKGETWDRTGASKYNRIK